MGPTQRRIAAEASERANIPWTRFQVLNLVCTEVNIYYNYY